MCEIANSWATYRRNSTRETLRMSMAFSAPKMFPRDFGAIVRMAVRVSPVVQEVRKKLTTAGVEFPSLPNVLRQTVCTL